MAAARLARTPSKRWVQDEEVVVCPLCPNRFDGNFLLDITRSGRTHCRYCGGVFCTDCCCQELYMPEDEVVRPPSSSKFKSIIFDPTLKQKACRTCVKILAPQQESIKASRGRGGGGSGHRATNFSVRKNPSGPHYTIVIDRAKSLRAGKLNAAITDPVCLLTVGNTSSITQPTQSGPEPVWDQCFDFPVQSEHGNSLKLTCYQEEVGGKTLIGEGSIKVAETGPEGSWVPITDDRRAVTGHVLIRSTFKGPRTPKPVSGVSRHLPFPMGDDLDTEDDSEHSLPVLHWLQENAWLVYVVLLLASVLYRFVITRGFSGDPISLRPGAPTGNNVSKRSETHYITLQKDGNLVLREGKPGDPVGAAPLWEGGRVDAKKDCAKCVFMLDLTGRQLQVKKGRKVLKEFTLAEDALLSAAIKIP